MKKVSIDTLYFGVKLMPLSYGSREELKSLKTYNLFDFGRVKHSVATYVVMPEEKRKALISDPLHFCFGDVWSRCEYEFIVFPFPYRDDETIEKSGIKVDTWTMYVEPNAKLLMEMVNSVSVNSARRYLREHRKLTGR